jgi:hypothetical protein
MDCRGGTVISTAPAALFVSRSSVGKALRIQVHASRIHKIVVSNCVVLPG